MKLYHIVSLIIILSYTCSSESKFIYQNETKELSVSNVEIPYDITIKTINILLALCDNKCQGIVPVPAGICNGQHCDSSLYWGYGMIFVLISKKVKNGNW